MKISTRGRYGLLAMVDLASQNNEESTKLKSIAERQGISEHYLEQLIAAFKKAGFVKSVRGSKGGYHLNKMPEDISVGDILRVMEGPLYPVECLSDDGDAACGSVDCGSCVYGKKYMKAIRARRINRPHVISLTDSVNNRIAKTLPAKYNQINFAGRVLICAKK
jgi:Rrf2 family protein